MHTDTPTEQQLAANAKGPRVTTDDIDAAITFAQYHVFPGTTLTVCALTLRNGFTVTGESACADPANFDPEVGEQFALKDAKRKVGPLLGYALREAITIAEQSA